MAKTLLITGGAGFVGSSLAVWLKARYPDHQIFALDNLKRRGSELNLSRLKSSGVNFLHGDIRNYEDLDTLPKIDLIIEASAEPSVLAGVDGSPDYLINTNLVGTTNCLKFALKNRSDLIFLSTSRVYSIENIEQIAFTETDTRFVINPSQTLKGVSENGIDESFSLQGYRSIYGATKLCSELLIEEYNKFFGLRTVINRCGVLAGPWQMGKADQGVAVLWMARHFWQGKLDYVGYGGTGKQVRDVLHIEDLCRLVDHQINNIDKLSGQTFNVGGGKETSLSLLELTALCEKLTGNTIEIGSEPANRTADIRMYISDNSKVTAATNWKPELPVYKIMEDIYGWIRDNEGSLKNILN